MLTTRTFSVMISQHTYAVRRACSHMLVFEVDDVLHWDVLGSLRRQAREVWKNVQCAIQTHYGITQKMSNFRHYCRLEKQYYACLKFFDMTGQLARPRDYDTQRRLAIAGQRKASIKYRRKIAQAESVRKEEEEAKKKKFWEVLPDWLIGRQPTHCIPKGDHPIYFRLSPHNDQIETSMGVFFTVDEAMAIWPKIKEVRRSGIAWTSGARYPEELHVGSYHIDRIDHTGDVHAGCHHIKWEQVKSLAVMLGILNAKTKNKRSPRRKTRQAVAK